MAVCKLNATAIEEAELTYDLVVAAVRTNFFRTMGNFVDRRMSDDDVLVAAASFIETSENDRASAFTVGLDKKVQKLAKKSAARSTQQAVAEAEALAKERKARALKLDEEPTDAIAGASGALQP